MAIYPSWSELIQPRGPTYQPRSSSSCTASLFYLGDPAWSFNHQPCRFVLKLRCALPASFWHLLPSVPVRTLLGRVSGMWEARHRVDDGIDTTIRIRTMIELWVHDDRIRTQVDKLAK